MNLVCGHQQAHPFNGEIDKNGGVVVLQCAVGSLTVFAATCNINGTGSVATLNCYGGTTYYNSTGALGGTAVHLYETALLDFSQDQQAKTVSTSIQRTQTHRPSTTRLKS